MTKPQYVLVPRDDYDGAIHLPASIKPTSPAIMEALRILQRGTRRDLAVQLEQLTREIYLIRGEIEHLHKLIRPSRSGVNGMTGMERRE